MVLREKMLLPGFMKHYTKKTIDYYDKIADDYNRSGAAVVVGNIIDRFSALLQGKKVLDVACGPGHDCRYLTQQGFECLGVDLSKNMIELARNNFGGRYEVMDIFDLHRQLEQEQESFDGLWCSSIFVHIQKNDLPQLLANIRKMLRPGGIIGIITALTQDRKKQERDTREYVMYDLPELARYFTEADFQIVVKEIFPYGGKDRIFMVAKK
jgi:2-polyprenyl-3-methyl-5-hydroxy-6-metoxy-1,4-benzoquinol methylase